MRWSDPQGCDPQGNPSDDGPVQDVFEEGEDDQRQGGEAVQEGDLVHDAQHVDPQDMLEHAFHAAQYDKPQQRFAWQLNRQPSHAHP